MTVHRILPPGGGSSEPLTQSALTELLEGNDYLNDNIAYFTLEGSNNSADIDDLKSTVAANDLSKVQAQLKYAHIEPNAWWGESKATSALHQSGNAYVFPSYFPRAGVVSGVGLSDDYNMYQTNVHVQVRDWEGYFAGTELLADFTFNLPALGAGWSEAHKVSTSFTIPKPGLYGIVIRQELNGGTYVNFTGSAGTRPALYINTSTLAAMYGWVVSGLPAGSAYPGNLSTYAKAVSATVPHLYYKYSEFSE